MLDGDMSFVDFLRNKKQNKYSNRLNELKLSEWPFRISQH